MYTYQVTYHFEKEKKRSEEYVNRPIADAFDSFLDSEEIQAERDGTTSTAYFRFGGDIEALKNYIMQYFRERAKETKKKISFAKKDVIAITCYKSEHHETYVVCRWLFKNNDLEPFPDEIENLFKSFYDLTVDDIKGRLFH